MATNWLEPEVRLIRNPWGESLADGVVLQTFMTAALNAREWASGEVEFGYMDGYDAFASVFLDPTRPRGQAGIQERIMAVILFGKDAFKLVPNAAAKADAHDRHGINNGELVREANFCLGDGDFAYGDSSYYKGAIAAGSGFTQIQDKHMVDRMLEESMTKIHDHRQNWIRSQRRVGGQLAWFNINDQPGAEYLAIEHLPYSRASSY